MACTRFRCRSRSRHLCKSLPSQADSTHQQLGPPHDGIRLPSRHRHIFLSLIYVPRLTLSLGWNCTCASWAGAANVVLDLGVGHELHSCMCTWNRKRQLRCAPGGSSLGVQIRTSVVCCFLGANVHHLSVVVVVFDRDFPVWCANQLKLNDLIMSQYSHPVHMASAAVVAK